MSLVCVKCGQSGSSHLATHCANPACRVNGRPAPLKMISTAQVVQPTPPVTVTPVPQPFGTFTVGPLSKE